MDYNRDLRIVRTRGNTYPLPYKNNVIWIHHDKNNEPIAEVWDHGRWVSVNGVGSGSGDIIIDTKMSDSSSNAIANKTVKKYVDGIASKTDASILSLNEGKVDKEAGKGLSANDLTDERAGKVDMLAKDGRANEFLNGAGTYSRPVRQGYGVSVADDNTVSVDPQVIARQSDVAALQSLIDTMNPGYQFVGVATPETNPGTPDQKVFYIANGKGTYTNFGGLEVTEDEVVILYYDTAWHKLLTGIASQEKLTELDLEVTELKAGLEGGKITLSGWNDGEYITTNQAIGSVCQKAVTQNASWRSIIVTVTSDIAKFVVNGDGGLSPRLWCFLDTEDKVLSQSDADATSTGDALELVPPSNATQLIINSKNREDCYKVIVGALPVIQEINTNTANNTASIKSINQDLNGLPSQLISDFSQFNIIEGYISSTGVWKPGESYVVNALELRGKVISVFANSQNNGLIAFCKGTISTNVTPEFCDGEKTGSVSVSAKGVFTTKVPNDCDTIILGKIVSGTDRTPIKLTIQGEDGVLPVLNNSIHSYPVEPVEINDYVNKYVINNSGIISSTDSAGKIYYKKFDKETKLSITLSLYHSSINSDRGIFGYIDSVEDITDGNTLEQTGNINFKFQETKFFEFIVPAGKVFCIFKYTEDQLSVYAEETHISAHTPYINIINGAYSWWTSPHSDRKVKGMNDYTIATYQKSTGELCISIRNNNTGVCKESFLMMGYGVDDHNGPACAFLSDGRIIVTCPIGHAAGQNQYIFISEKPFLIDSFEKKVFETTGNCTYSRLIIQGNYIFIFWREKIENVSYWHGVYSTDEFATNSGEFDFIRNSYVYLEKTTDPDYIKIYPCGHPTENAVELDAIRSGYIKLSTMEILKGDGITKVADLGTFVDNTDFDILVDATITSKNRMLDAAITPVGVDRFVYAKGDPSSNPYDAKYYYYNNGTIIEIAPTGKPFYTASKYVGGAIITRQNNDVLIVSREDNGIWKLEKYKIKDGIVNSVSIIDFSEEYIMRPIECGGCQFIYQKGGYKPSSFKDFKTNIIFKDITL